jgi:hypothetical protein
MVYDGKSYYKWMITGGNPHDLGKLHGAVVGYGDLMGFVSPTCDVWMAFNHQQLGYGSWMEFDGI